MKLKESTNNLSSNQQQSNIRYFVIGFIIVLALTIPVIVFDAFVRPDDKAEYYNAKIDSLNHSIDSLENCINLIKPKIDTVYQQKTLIKYLYNEKADTIWNQSADDDWNYYTKFLSTRFPSDSCSIETN